MSAESLNVEVFAPGRANLIGEHTDYNGGLVLPFAIERGLQLRLQFQQGPASTASPSNTALVCHSTFDGVTRTLSAQEFQALFEAVRAKPLTSDEVTLPQNAQKNTLCYVAGALALFLAQCHPNTAPSAGTAANAAADFMRASKAAAFLSGHAQLRVHIDSTLPAGAGLSSSAALCTGVLQGAQALFGGTLSGRDLARTAMYVEHRFAGAKVGLMDQLAVTFGRPGHFLAIDFFDFPEEGAFGLEWVQPHKAFDDFVPLLFHTGVSHSLASSEYNVRREQCQAALEMLRHSVNLPRAFPLTSLSAFSLPEGFRALFGKELEEVSSGRFTQAHAESHLQRLVQGNGVLAKRAAHVVFENVRVRLATDALRHGRREELSRVMQESHASLQNSFEVSCRELDTAALLVAKEAARLTALSSPMGPSASAVTHQEAHTVPLIGARMTGGGFGGSTVQLVHKSIVHPLVDTFSREDNPYTQATGSEPRLFVLSPAEGLRLHYT